MGNKADRNIQVMGIVNLTDDSFFAGSRNLRADGTFDEELFRGRIVNMLESGADILDLGACSTRPGSDSISEEEEWKRLEPALHILASEHPEVRISIDTFRPSVVSRAFDIVGPFVVNDVSGGCEDMWRLLGQLQLPYIAMHTRGTPKNMQSLTDYDNVTEVVREFFEGIAAEADRYGRRLKPAPLLLPADGVRSRTGRACTEVKDVRSRIKHIHNPSAEAFLIESPVWTEVAAAREKRVVGEVDNAHHLDISVYRAYHNG